MGASREQLGSLHGDGGTSSSQCEGLLSRVAHLENLLHTLKLKVFRIETEKELGPSNTARLQVQLEVLQEQCEVELRSSQREASRLRTRLQQEQLHSSHCTQVHTGTHTHPHTPPCVLSVSTYFTMILWIIFIPKLLVKSINAAVAAEELKRLKVQMSQKLQQMKEELEQESAARLEAEQSHDTLLQTLRETETALEKEQEQVKALEAECDALHAEEQDLKEDVQEKVGIIQVLQNKCQQLRQRSGDEDALISKLTNELKGTRVSVQKEQQENETLISVGEELRAAADKVQGLYDDSEARCSDLSSALRSLTEENMRLQELLKVEQERVAQRLKDQDVQLDIAKGNMLSELQAALADRLLQRKEIETLWKDHTHLQRSSAAALEAAVSHQELLERTTVKLREDLSNTVTERDTVQQEKEEVQPLHIYKTQELHPLLVLIKVPQVFMLIRSAAFQHRNI
ncbi:coiled-coil domain-containing protein 150 [Trichomycterus rosablanca]|uniref:coiled-coil domain-containing protein 150 n=1 Tax=Trichomycterus rosablanca TaxID=2290929 RepID=UPI002F352105